DRPLARYFPELVAALLALPEREFVLDGEIVAADFAALLARLHPAASRVERLAAETPARLVAFDVLAAGGRDLRERPFVERRAVLEALLEGAPPALEVTAITDDPNEATQWFESREGVVAKHRELRYEPGRR